jgi:dipicolinate synthase subunit A
MSGDPRNARLCEIITEEGREACLFSQREAAEAAAFGDIIVLPVKGMAGDLFNGLLRDGQLLVTGEDFLSREDFLVLNALTTAEGALGLAMSDMPVTLHSSEVLVTGYGRIGKLLCQKLLALGAFVTASARKNSDFAWMDAHGVEPVHTMKLDGTLHCYDAVFNTIPHLTLTSARLRELKPSCVIIDLASAPGGTDFKAAERLGLCCRWALSLPGKTAPESAALNMRMVLESILSERGVKL